jgi:hypothetical protein
LKRLGNVVITSGVVLIFVLAFVSFNIYAQALTILVSHGGSGDLELCVESNGYEDQCDDFNLSEYNNPFEYVLEVEDPDQGHNFQVCYEIRDTNAKDCRNFEFTGSSQQTVNVEIPSTGLPVAGGNTNNIEDFSLQNPIEDSQSPTATPEAPPELPPLPPTLP